MKALTKKEIFSLPNCITMFRIVGTACMVFTDPLKEAFYTIYTLCGISDVLDGWIARRRNQTSELGSKLDSIADLTYYFVMALMILPELIRILPAAIWYAVIAIVGLRVASYLLVAFKFHRFASTHTYGNKLTGAGVFGIPYFIATEYGVIYCVIACTVAALASMEEFIIHLFMKSYDKKPKTLSQLMRLQNG